MLIGWGDCVQMCKIQQSGKKEVMKITHAFRTDYTICGIAPFSYKDPDNKSSGGKTFTISILTFPSKDEDHENKQGGGGGSSAKEKGGERIPARKPKIRVLRYSLALEAAEKYQRRLKSHKIFEIRENYLNHLVDVGEYPKAASFCPRLLAKNKKMWESWIYFFAEKKHLSTIAPQFPSFLLGNLFDVRTPPSPPHPSLFSQQSAPPLRYIPVKDPKLSKKIYDLVLNHLIYTSPKGLLKYLHVWPVGVYTMQHTISAVIDRLNQKVGDQSPDLMRALGELYMVDKQFEKAIQVYLELKSEEVFVYVKDLDLFSHVKGCVQQMMELDVERTLQLLLENLHRFTVREVELYALYEPVLLLNFLRSSNFYDLEEALKLCKTRKLYNEMVFILNRMGSASDALMIIIYKLQDVKRAIE
eukprot:jgi/Bigna1/72731/fgenesh1_pg.21_\